MNRFKVESVKLACESKLSAIRSIRGKMLKELALQNPTPSQHPKSLEAAYFQEDEENHVLALLSYLRDIQQHGGQQSYVHLTLSDYRPLQGHFPRESRQRLSEVTEVDVLRQPDTEE